MLSPRELASKTADRVLHFMKSNDTATLALSMRWLFACAATYYFFLGPWLLFNKPLDNLPGGSLAVVIAVVYLCYTGAMTFKREALKPRKELEFLLDAGFCVLMYRMSLEVKSGLYLLFALPLLMAADYFRPKISIALFGAIAGAFAGSSLILSFERGNSPQDLAEALLRGASSWWSRLAHSYG